MAVYMSQETRTKIWELLCDFFVTDKPFRVRDARLVLERELGLSPRTSEQYVVTVLERVAAQEETPDLPKQAKKVGRGTWVLPSVA